MPTEKLTAAGKPLAKAGGYFASGRIWPFRFGQKNDIMASVVTPEGRAKNAEEKRA